MIYTKFDSRWSKVISKDDIVSVDTINGWKQGTAVLLNLEYVRIRIDETGSLVDANCKSVKILKKKISEQQNVQIEISDLVTIDYDNEIVSGIITSTDMSVEVLITSSKKNGRKVTVQPESLKFVAKGYSTEPFSSLTTLNNSNQKILNHVDPYNQNHTQLYSHGVAVLYPAPCIIMVVPPQVRPEDYPEAMAVQFPWRPNDSPTILPVIRMRPGTVVVIVPGDSAKDNVL